MHTERPHLDSSTEVLFAYLTGRLTAEQEQVVRELTRRARPYKEPTPKDDTHKRDIYHLVSTSIEATYGPVEAAKFRGLVMQHEKNTAAAIQQSGIEVVQTMRAGAVFYPLALAGGRLGVIIDKPHDIDR